MTSPVKVKTLSIQPLGFEPAVTEAARVLERYLPLLAPVHVQTMPARHVPPRKGRVDIILGTANRLDGVGLGRLPDLHPLDDELAIIPKSGVLYLAGSNPRSVLFAAYRLLEELGCVFLRPGPDGEILPRRARLALPKRAIRERASHRHRGICIEGSPRLEHVLNLLDWMAKKKMNTFQLQFRHSGVFWRRGYQSVEMDEATRSAPLTEADCESLDERIVARVKELGMILHRVGHGWTAFAVGLPGNSWEKTTAMPPAAKANWLAQVGGKRGVWKEVPVNTELCYSRLEVRQALIEEVVAYARRHPEVDVLHVWMSDAYNNKCECEDCRTQTPTDWYVMIVDAVARRLKEECLATRVVFLAYVDLLWPPTEARITSDNVLFMFAPITRCYRHALTAPQCGADSSAARPALNRCVLPRTNRFHAEIARMWLPLRLPDSFLFDYHLMWAVWRDGLGQDIGATMAQDVKSLAQLGLNGLVSCQATRAFYPLPYLPNAMADLLWNKRLEQCAHRRKIMKAAFGRHTLAAESYFHRMVRAFRVGGDYDHKTLLDDVTGNQRRLRDILRIATDAWQDFLARAKKEKEAVVRLSLHLLALHAEQVCRIVSARLAGISGSAHALKELRASYESRLPEILREFAPWVDPLIRAPVAQALTEAEKEITAREGSRT